MRFGHRPVTEADLGVSVHPDILRQIDAAGGWPKPTSAREREDFINKVTGLDTYGAPIPLTTEDSYRLARQVRISQIDKRLGAQEE